MSSPNRSCNRGKPPMVALAAAFMVAIALIFGGTGKSRAQQQPTAESTSPEQIQIGISVDVVPVASEFAGRSIAVFGTVDNADPFARLLNAYAIAVVIRGPEQNIVVRRKERILGIWVNRQARTYRGVPSFYAVASNREIDSIASPEVLREAQLGIDNLSLSLFSTGKSAFILPEPEFAASLRRIQLEDGLFSENPKGVDFLGASLFRATLQLPSSIPIGVHRVTAYLFRDGKLLSSRESSFQVRKVGFEESLYRLAHEQGLLHGIIAVLVALATGWAASIVFGRR